MPGALPVVNTQVVDYAIKTGVALNCQINRRSVFARKNYFYPDLPKGYQISQYDQPICGVGKVEISVDGVVKSITIERAHLEEDAGKSIHDGEYSLINLNRSSVPLLEIVSGPDMRSAQEASEYARTVRQILRYIGVCDGNLEEGSLRCDCNVSVRKKGASELGTKVEIKNINSFRFIEKAIEHEIERQIDCVEMGEPIHQETRLYDTTKNKTFSMRSKEEAHDYRYFPEPDLLPVEFGEGRIKAVLGTMPELPAQKIYRFCTDYGIPEYDARVLTQERELAEFYELVAKASNNPKAASNWVMGELLRELNSSKLDIAQSPVSETALADLIKLIDSKVISGKIAKTVFLEMWEQRKPADQIIKEKGLVQISDKGAIEKMIDEVLEANPDQLAQYREGKTKLYGFFVGEIMKLTKGQANPGIVNQILKSKLG
jgi:aspartyl-tRNA(Asn)/glutamyl-tRNA(Gln) amidotransferase subunit B